jgi:hypothetical protein
MRFLRSLSFLPCVLVACGGSVDDVSPVDAATDTALASDTAITPDTRPAGDTAPSDSTVSDGVADTATIDTAPRPDTGMLDVIINGEGLDAWEGKTITFVTVNDPTPSGITFVGKIVGGKVTASFPATMSKDVFGFFVDVWIDLGGDGACTTGTDPIYTHFVSNTFADPVVSTFKPGATTDKTDCTKVGMR